MGCRKLSYNPGYEGLEKSTVHFLRAPGKKRVRPKICSNYYPFGLQIGSLSWQREDATKNNYLYNGKELQDDLDLNWHDYGARMYDAALGRWHMTDGKAELYFGTSPYVYALNTPTNAIDPDGQVVIFINGNHYGSGGKPEYWRKVLDFDRAVMRQFNDFRAIYRDGAKGGWAPLNGVHPGFRYTTGYARGQEDAAMIINNLARDKNGNITESIKVITHSMGAAYGKGYIRALKEYIRKHNIQGVGIIEADFAPFQPTAYGAVDGVPTLQFSHSDDDLAGNKPVEGAGQVDTSEDSDQGHSIESFINQVKKLPTGSYKVINGKIEPVNKKKSQRKRRRKKKEETD